MAIINSTILSVNGDTAKVIKQWANMTFSGSDVGDNLEIPEYADRSVQVIGTPGAGGTVIIEGSNNGTDYAVLKDHLGNNLSFTAADIRSIDQIVRFIRPRVTGGDGTTSFTVIVLVRRLS